MHSERQKNWLLIARDNEAMKSLSCVLSARSDPRNNFDWVMPPFLHLDILVV